jgi:hypothetical protein
MADARAGLTLAEYQKLALTADKKPEAALAFPLLGGSEGTAGQFDASCLLARPGAYRRLIKTPGQASDAALAFQRGTRTARLEYRNIGAAHLFMAVAAGIAMMIGQLLNRFSAVQTYEHVTVDGSTAQPRFFVRTLDR